MAIETIRRKKGKIYRAVLYTNGQRKSRCFKRKYDAQKWLDDQQNLQSYGGGHLKFSEAAKLWLENHSKIRKAPGSHQGDQRMIESFEPMFGHLDLDQITPELIERYIGKTLVKGRKPATVNRYLECLRAILNYFVKKRYLSFNPVSSVGLLPEPQGAYDYLSFEEAKTFLSYTEQKYRDRNRWIYRLYLLAMNTGLRWGEIIALKWDRVDLANKRILVARSYCRFSKEIRETTKGKRIRHMGINQALLPELQDQYEENSKRHGLVFSKNKKVLDRKNFFRDHFLKDLENAGMRKIRFHDFRHTFASHFMMNGGNLYDLQKLLGHQDISTTERYAHLSPESLVQKTELICIDGGSADVIQLDDIRKIG